MDEGSVDDYDTETFEEESADELSQDEDPSTETLSDISSDDYTSNEDGEEVEKNIAELHAKILKNMYPEEVNQNTFRLPTDEQQNLNSEDGEASGDEIFNSAMKFPGDENPSDEIQSLDICDEVIDTNECDIGDSSSINVVDESDLQDIQFEPTQYAKDAPDLLPESSVELDVPEREGQDTQTETHIGDSLFVINDECKLQELNCSDIQDVTDNLESNRQSDINNDQKDIVDDVQNISTNSDQNNDTDDIFDDNLSEDTLYNEIEVALSVRSETPSRSFGSQNIGDQMSVIPQPRKSGQRKNQSFSNDRLREIERHNQILLRKILSTKTRTDQTSNSNVRQSSSAINRKKHQRQIDLDNQILKRKLEAISVRPSKFK